MNAVLSAIAPVFLLIFLGYGVRRSGLLADSFWESAERLTYFLLFPALIVATLADADLTGLQVLPMAGALIGAILVVAALVMLLKPVLGLDGAGLTSAFQGAVRMNTYIALALAAAAHGAPGLAAAAVAVAVIVPLVNVLCVAVLARHGDGARPTVGGVAVKVLGNPLILACAVGVGLNAAGLGLPPVVKPMAQILGRAALGLALLSVGAGLDFTAARAGGRALVIVSALKLAVLPALTALGCWVLGAGPMGTFVAVLFNGTPTATSSYILARQMGGDAKLMAQLLAGETALAMATLPAILLLLA